MRLRVLCSILFCFSLLLALNVTAQLPTTTSPRNAFDRDNAVITGMVYGPGGLGVGGVLVELRDYVSKALLASVTTRSDGSFELYNMAVGSYEVVAEARGEQAREYVPANSMMTRVELRLRPITASGAQGQSISVARLKVPQKARDRYNKAEEAFVRHKFPQAEKAVNASLAIYAENPEAITLHGLIAFQNRDLDQALMDFQKSINLDPSYEVAYTAMSSLLNSQRKFDDAERTTQQAVALNPAGWQGYFELARAFLGKGLYENALAAAGKAQSFAPESFSTIHLLKAYAMVPLKRFREAAVELQAFLSHPPQGQDVSSVKQLLAQVQSAETATAAVQGPAQGMSLVAH